MSKTSVIFLVGLILGIIIASGIIYLLSPRLILKEDQSKYNFEKSVSLLEKEITDTNWKIPAKHDLQKTLQKFGKEDVNKVMVIEACNPDLAEKILKTDDERIVSNMMPCRIAIYEKSDGKTYFSRMNSGLLAKPMGEVSREQMKIAAEDIENFLGVLN